MINIYLYNDILFAKNYERIVHGKRGDYVELIREQIICDLANQTYYNSVYYDYYIPIPGNSEKIYLQKRTVSYADYKIGYLYINPSFIKNIKDIYEEESNRNNKYNLILFK
jgi:hypothetical protein